MMLPTTTVHRYLVPTMLGASRRCISAVSVIAVVAVIVSAAVAAGFVVAALAAVAFFFAVFLGGPEELEGVSNRWVVAAGGGADLLFRGGIGSIPGEAVVAVALRLLLEQESEVLAIGLGLVVFEDDPKVELLYILVQRGEHLVRRCRVVLRRRLPALRDGVEGGDRGA